MCNPTEELAGRSAARFQTGIKCRAQVFIDIDIQWDVDDPAAFITRHFVALNITSLTGEIRADRLE